MVGNGGYSFNVVENLSFLFCFCLFSLHLHCRAKYGVGEGGNYSSLDGGDW